MEGIVSGVHNAVTRHIHHAGTHHCTDNHAHRGNNHHRFELCHLGTDGRIEEVYRIIAHSHKQVEHCQNEQERHYQQINNLHILCLLLFFGKSRKQMLQRCNNDMKKLVKVGSIN